METQAAQEPELLSPTNASADLSSEVLQPIQEICAIAKQGLIERRLAKQPRKRSGSNSASQKKRLRNGKIMETALEVLKPEPQTAVDAREEAYVSNYFHKVRATLNSGQFNQFCAILEKLQAPEPNVLKAFRDLSTLFAHNEELLEDFIPLLTTEQALDCGVFMQHLMLTKMADFLLVLETHFAKTPYLNKRVLAAIETLSYKPTVTVQEVINTILPLLKGHPVLTDFFLQLLPTCRPPDCLRTDWDEVDEEALSDVSDEGDGPWERVDLPPMVDPYGGPACVCTCHESEDEKFRTRAQHCLSCSIKFMNGKVFIQSGKLLRRAQITFTDHDMEYHRRRLFPGSVEPRKRKRSSSHTSPNKSQLSSDELKSDDDEKKGKRRAKAVKKAVKTDEECEKVSSSKSVPCKEETCLLSPDLLSPNEDLAEKESFLASWQLRARKMSEPSETKESGPNLAPVQLLIVPQEGIIKVEEPDDFDSIPVIIEGESKEFEAVSSLNAVAMETSPVFVVLNEGEPIQLEPEPNIPVETFENDSKCSEVTVETKSELQTCSQKTEVHENTHEEAMVPKTEELATSTSGTTSSHSEPRADLSAEEGSPWTIDEDKIILRTLKVEPYCEETFVKISQTLSGRTVEDIKSRFQHLLNILYKMKAESNE